MLLSELLHGVSVIGEYKDTEISDVTDFTGNVSDGSAFVCIDGNRIDGHIFSGTALAGGAAAVIVSKDLGLKEQVLVDNTRKAYALMCKNLFGCAADSLKIIGITGTNGKTTTAFILNDILKSSGFSTGLIGTVKNIIGETAFPAELTTPSPHILHELFSRMKACGTEYCVMEASSQAFHQERLAGINFSVGVFTNLTQDHLDYHGTIDEYKRCKKMLFNSCATAVLNADDGESAYMCDGINAKVITYGYKQRSDFFATDIFFDEGGVQYTVNGKYDVYFPVPGGFSVSNSLAAAATAEALGLDIAKVAPLLSSANPVPGRMERVKTGTGYNVFIDYAHTPDGLFKAIEAVRSFTKGRVITVFGCGGDRDSRKRPKMGKIASQLSDIAVVTTDNPRTEKPDSIIKEILEGTSDGSAEIIAVTDRTEAIKCALKLAKTGDTVLLTGKGHETCQIIGRERVHYDEREIIATLLKKGEGFD